MQRGSSEERITSGNTSPRLSHKSSNSTFFGIFGRRTTKVEPQLDNDDQLIYTTTASREHNISFAKCLTESSEGPNDKSVIDTANRLNNNINFTSSSSQVIARVKARSHTLPLANCVNNNMEKSCTSSSGGVSGGFLNFHRRIKSSPPVTKCSTFISGLNTTTNPHSNDGSLSDGGGNVVLRAGKSSKHRSPNHNRFSHQFNLCCKTERKPMTPPVTVRYNSLSSAGGHRDVKRDSDPSTTCQSLDHTNSPQLSFTTSDVVAATAVTIKCLPPPLQAPLNPGIVNVSSSAPQSPVTTKTTFSLPNSSSHSSPSNSSLKSTQSETPCGALSKCGGGPIRPIAVTACRSRLRLKLLPPGKEMPKQFIQLQTPSNEPPDTAWKPTSSAKHMSSPNISTNPIELNADNSNIDMRFLSHENIQLTKQKSQGGGLAMQALMAAQVLSLIPTDKARERSFLSGRLGSSTLMGPSELNRVLPNKEVTVLVGTWNMNGQNPPKQMNDFVLPTSVEHVPDIVAIGTQESSPDRFEWEASIQETLGPSHVLFHAATLGTLHLAIFIRRDLIWYCSSPEDASMSVRTGSAFRTKGAVAISFCLFGTSILFVTSHLTAHQQKVKERVSDVKRITHALDLPKNLQLRHKCKDVTENFDDVFWCGDLNFRLSEPREKLLEWIQHTKFPLPSHLPHGYMHTDQLSSVLADGAAFRGFMEANITFPPTYKYDPGTQHFDTSSKQRAPAYTDRILYKFRQPQGFSVRRQSTTPGGTTNVQPFIQCLLYDSVPSIITSDHKPVLALFKVLIRAGTDAIPLAGGLFNREIYLEGIKRRLNNQHQGSSAVCSIQ